MSCYNQQFTGMPDYSGRGGSMGWGWSGNMGMPGNTDMPAWNDGYTQMNNPPAAVAPAAPSMPACGFCPDSGKYPLAMSYVPMQRWTQPLPIETALARGTIFSELDLPFMMGRCQ